MGRLYVMCALKINHIQSVPQRFSILHTVQPKVQRRSARDRSSHVPVRAQRAMFATRQHVQLQSSKSWRHRHCFASRTARRSTGSAGASAAAGVPDTECTSGLNTTWLDTQPLDNWGLPDCVVRCPDGDLATHTQLLCGLSGAARRALTSAPRAASTVTPTIWAVEEPQETWVKLLRFAYTSESQHAVYKFVSAFICLRDGTGVLLS